MDRVRFGLFTSSYPTEDIVRSGILAEKHGFDSVWVPDHLTDLYPTGDKVDPWVVLATIGAHTKKIMLSPAVTDTQRVHPAKTAQIVATLDELTDGRAALAIGAGEVMNLVPYGILFESKEERAERLGEAIKVAKLLWGSTREKRVSFQGKYYRLVDAVLDQHPVRTPHPPVYVGALGTIRTLRLVGELGDGWLPWTNTPETYSRRLSDIRVAAEKAGRSIDSIDCANITHVAVTNDPEMRERVLDAMKTEILITTHRKVLSELGYDVKGPVGFDYTYQRVVAQESVGDRAGDVAADMPDRVAEKFVVVGDVDEVIGGIEKFIRAGAGHIVLRDIIGMSIETSLVRAEETLKTFGEKIIPHFTPAK